LRVTSRSTCALFSDAVHFDRPHAQALERFAGTGCIAEDDDPMTRRTVSSFSIRKARRPRDTDPLRLAEGGRWLIGDGNLDAPEAPHLRRACRAFLCPPAHSK